jgi:predicted outer membrane protein
MKKFLVSGAVLALALTSLITHAQSPAQQSVTSSPSWTTTTPTSSPSGGPSAIDLTAELTSLTNTEALNFLHHVNVLEINESEQALQEVTLPQAITLAQTMLTDSQQNEMQVQQLAAIKGVTLYMFQPATYEVAAEAQLATLSGTQYYDAAFASLELLNQQSALQTLQLMLNSVTDPDIKSLINQTIPVVQQHIQLAQAVLSAEGVSTQPTASPSPSPSASVSPSPSPSVSPIPSPSPSVQPSASPSVLPSGTPAYSHRRP